VSHFINAPQQSHNFNNSLSLFHLNKKKFQCSLFFFYLIFFLFNICLFSNGHIIEYLPYSNGHIFKNLNYILLFFTIFKIVNTDKIYFLKLCLDGLENERQN
jgi:hypothetical protein